MLVIGEIHTGLLLHSGAVPVDLAVRLLDLVPGVRVAKSERPLDHAISPEIVVGVDCHLAGRTGARVRGAGTAISRAVLTGGHIIQGSAFTRVRRADSGRRLPWSHYLAQPGVLELLGKAADEDIAAEFLVGHTAKDLLDLGAIAARTIDSVQVHPALDRQAALRATRTRLRWAVHESDRDPTLVTLTIEDGPLRTLQGSVPAIGVPALASFCEDLALHDWLLTTLSSLVSRAQIGRIPLPDVVARLQPAFDHLLHLWMPAARTHPAIADLWADFDHRPGFTRQWQATVGRIRDQLLLASIESSSAHQSHQLGR